MVPSGGWPAVARRLTIRWKSCYRSCRRGGGRLSRNALAQALAQPAVRIGGMVSAARRLVNLDQAQVLMVDGDDVVLDVRLLREQFQLDGDR